MNCAFSNNFQKIAAESIVFSKESKLEDERLRMEIEAHEEFLRIKRTQELWHAAQLAERDAQLSEKDAQIADLKRKIQMLESTQ